jgi:two-component system, LuxR family, response regulator FixJ
MSDEHVICVVDDDEAVRDSLEILLETMGYTTSSYESGPAFLENCQSFETGCVLLDVRMPKMNGMEVQKRLMKIRDDFPVIIVTGHGDITMAVQAMQAGAVDFIEKPFQEEALLQSIGNALSLADSTHEHTEEVADIKIRLDRLTPREREVFEQLIIGHSNKVVARALECSPRTVEIHRARVLEKMQSDSIAQLVRLALVAGIEITDC